MRDESQSNAPQSCKGKGIYENRQKFYSLGCVLLLATLVMLPGDSLGKASNNETVTSSSADYSDTGNSNGDSHLLERNYCLGFSAAFPFLFGVRYERFLKKSSDRVPEYLLTTDLSITPIHGFGLIGGSLLLEKRLSGSWLYIGGGYNLTALAFGFQAGEVGGAGVFTFHSIVASMAARSSYFNHFIWNFSLGALITPSLFDNQLPVVPLVRFGFTS